MQRKERRARQIDINIPRPDAANLAFAMEGMPLRKLRFFDAMQIGE